MMAGSLRTASVWLAALGLFSLGAWLQARGTIPSIIEHRDDVLQQLRQHILLAAVSGALAISIGVPLGILLTRGRFRALSAVLAQIWRSR